MFGLWVRRALRACFTIVLVASASTTSGAQGDPVGGEFLVQSPGSVRPAVAMDSVGNSIVAWQSGTSVGLARYSADGATLGTLSWTSANSGSAAVAMSDTGSYIVAYLDSDGAGTGVFAKMWRADGTLIGTFQVNQVTSSNQAEPAVAMTHDGKVVVAWSSSNQNGSFSSMRTRSINADGTFATGEVNIHPYESGSFNYVSPSVAFLNQNGDYVIAYAGFDSSNFGVLANRRSFSGNPLGTQGDIHVNVNESSYQWEPSVAADQNGNFVIAWESSGQDIGGGYAVIARKFDAAGSPLSGEIWVNTTTAGNQMYPSVATDRAGDFNVTWQSQNQDGSGYGIYGQNYAPDTTPISGERAINTTTAGDQIYPASAENANGDLLVAWQSGTDVRAARFKGPTAVDLAVTLSPSTNSVQQGNAYAYTVNVANNYDPTAAPLGTASGVVLDLALPQAAVANSIAGTGWTCSIGGNNLATCARPTFTGTSSITVQMTAPPTSQTLEADVDVRGNQDDSDSSNNASSLIISVVDQVPDSFSFPNHTDVARGSTQDWDSITITGIDTPTPIAVTNGLYSVNGGAYTSASGNVNNGDSVRVRHAAASGFSQTVTSYLQVGSSSASFSSTTIGADTAPDQFSFTSQTNVAQSTLIVSDPVTITGINTAAPISVSGGMFSINGGQFQSTSATITNGQSVRVRHVSSASYSTTVTSTLTIGGVSASFSSTTLVLDDTPDPITFATQTDVSPSTNVTSEAVTVTGINAPVQVSIEGGLFSVNGGTFRSSPATISNGQTLRISQLSASSFSTSHTSTIHVGQGTATFTTVTVARDMTPDPLPYADHPNTKVGSRVESEVLTVSGMNTYATVSVTNGEMRVAGGAWTTSTTTISSGQTLQLAHYASSQFSTDTVTTVTIGDGSASMRSTTEARDDTPDPFDFVDVTGALPHGTVLSNVITVTGINTPVMMRLPASVPLTQGGGSICAHVNGGSCSYQFAQVQNGDTVQLEIAAAPVPTQKITIPVSIGQGSDTWSVTTLLAAPLSP